ncbi:MAG: redoxin domain-containing protein [Candidatus Kerfeldbacteria bacterium]|nr:redoxin domain-containing protein [Candidatus Kerfeldbacteria bacterium]
MTLLLLSFIGGVLTVASPCVLPMLPVIIGSATLAENKRKPLVIIFSLALSIVIFTLLLKSTTLLINVPSMVWTTVSGVIILILGLSYLYPNQWTRLMIALKLQRGSEEMLHNTSRISSPWLKDALTGAALGPVFSSCSPTYFFVLATVLPQTFAVGLLNLCIYALGLALTLLAIARFGRRVTRALGYASNPESTFRKAVGILLIIVGIAIATGIDKKIESRLVASGLSATGIESALLENFQFERINETTSSDVAMNVRDPKLAPEFIGLTNWMNSAPLTLAELRGKVVIIDFWTYSCINCIRTLPTLTSWYETYKDDGFVIVGISAPEFAFERIPSNVQAAVERYEITYPIALDNDFLTWRAYDNAYWPAKYFIDRQGRLRHTHFGEGDYEESEAIIRALLQEDGATTVSEDMVSGDVALPISNLQSPETYLGYERAKNFDNAAQRTANMVATYSNNGTPNNNHWSLNGDWNIQDEKITSASDDAQLSYTFSAKDVYLVITSDEEADIAVELGGQDVNAENAGADVANSIMHIDTDRLYHIVSLPSFASKKTLTLTVPKGVSLHAFTFGS